jgi:hypothetical protein
MTTWIRVSMLVAATGATMPFAGGVASAAEEPSDTQGSTQSPTQALDSGLATVENAVASLVDGLNEDNRPDGANGLESEFIPFDPRFVEGPVGGLLNNGPFE